MNIVICDDINSYALFLKKSLTEILNNMSIEAEFTLISELSDLETHLNNTDADLIFLDIMFKNESSINWWLKNFNSKNINVIFMTSYPEEAYNISEVDNALFMVKSRTDSEQLKRLILKSFSHIANRASNPIAIKVKSSVYTVKTNDIIFIESYGNSIIIHLENKTLKTRSTISGFLKKLPFNFIRIHKSYIVNMNYVIRTEPYKFLLKNDITIAVNPRKFTDLEQKYQQYISLI